MTMLFSLFARAKPHAPVTRPKPGSARRELLSSAIRDTMRTHGIPSSWLAAEAFPASTPANQPGLHLRLVIKNANPKLLAHLLALERAIHERLKQLDAQSQSWVAGTSWRVDASDGAENAGLPGPEFWQASRPQLRTPQQPADAREILSRSLAAGDRAFARTTWQAPEFATTEPMPAR